MSARQLAGLALVLGGAWAFLRNRSATTLPGPPLKPPTALPGAVSAPAGYVGQTIARESGGDPMAKNPNSSASGKYQFTKATWLKLGGQWGSDKSKPFGGLAPSVAEQDARFAALTRSNASGLVASGLAAGSAALYAAHFLGLPVAVKVLTAAASTNLASLVGSKVMASNPQLSGFTVGDFKRWLERR